MKNAMMTICLLMVALISLNSQTMAWVQYNDGGTHDITTTINDDVWIDWEMPGMGTTVNVINGANISNPYEMRTYNDSVLNISGGLIDLSTNDRSQVMVSGGTIWDSHFYDSSHIEISDGTLFSHTLVEDNTDIIITGGTLSQGITLRHDSQGTMLGGRVEGDMFLQNNSQYELLGGTFELGKLLILSDNSILRVIGSDFAIDGVSIGDGIISSVTGTQSWNEPYRRLTGTLQNGDIIDNRFQIGNTAQIVIVPEPTTIVLLLGALPFVRRKKK